MLVQKYTPDDDDVVVAVAVVVPSAGAYRLNPRDELLVIDSVPGDSVDTRSIDCPGPLNFGGLSVKFCAADIRGCLSPAIGQAVVKWTLCNTSASIFAAALKS